MDQNKQRMSIVSQLCYYPSVLMFHSRNTENRVSKIHQRPLKLVWRTASKNIDNQSSKKSSVPDN